MDDEWGRRAGTFGVNQSVVGSDVGCSAESLMT